MSNLPKDLLTEKNLAIRPETTCPSVNDINSLWSGTSSCISSRNSPEKTKVWTNLEDCSETKAYVNENG